MNEKERLKKALHHEKTDRPPCICPGGMMNMITTDLMDRSGITWPEAHLNAEMMADLAQANYENGCFENVGVPFCMTIEAESMGAKITMGDRVHEPHVTEYALHSVKEWEKIRPMDMNSGRTKVVLDAIRILKSRNLDVPIIGNITGPVSTASSVMEPVIFYKELRKKKEDAHKYMELVADEIIRFARAQIDAGADIIAISDPSGTGEILGPKLFEEYAVHYINRIIDHLQALSRGVCTYRATLGSGFQIYNPESGKFTTYNVQNSGITSDFINSLFLPDKDEILIGHSQNYSIFNFGTRKVTNVNTTKEPVR